MPHPFILVVALLTVESSYMQNSEQPSRGVPDTVQFWLTPDADWRIKTFATDHDIHVHTLRHSGQERRFGATDAEKNTRDNYGDVIGQLVILQFDDPSNAVEVAHVLGEHGLKGRLERGKTGVAFYNPDGGHYRTQSTPQ